MSVHRFMSLLIAVQTVDAWRAVPHRAPELPASRVSFPRMSASDDALWASLRQRISSEPQPSGSGLPPLGPDEVGATSMGPNDVVSYIMKAMTDCENEEGCKVLLGFAATADSAEDSLGQVQPGAFPSPAAMKAFFDGHARYSSLMALEEWKAMGSPEMSDMSRKAAQKLLVRREGRNWEDLFINMELVDAATVGKRWIVTTIYKQTEADA